MIEFIERLDAPAEYDCVISLDYDSRKRGRLKVVTDSGEVAGIFLNRGLVLLDGDCLRSKDGRTVIVRAAPEPLIEAAADDPLKFAKVCYHLGNRHTPLEISTLKVYFQPDHVLSDMCRGLGLTVRDVKKPFCPEAGAYDKGFTHHHGF